MQWFFNLLGGRKMTVFLAIWGTVIVALLQAVQAQWPQTGTTVGWLLSLLALSGVGTTASIAHEDGKKAQAKAMVTAAEADAEAAKANARTAAIQASAPAAPGAGT